MILGRAGQPVRDEYQAKNWTWACSTCKSRSVAAACDGTKAGAPHAAVKAPFGYRVHDRLVASPEATD